MSHIQAERMMQDHLANKMAAWFQVQSSQWSFFIHQAHEEYDVAISGKMVLKKLLESIASLVSSSASVVHCGESG